MAQRSAKPLTLPNDPRFEHRYERVNGIRYHYLFAEPKNGQVKATVVLIHGWPDLSAGWRYQIPMFLELGCRVIAPDMMGYGGTDAPQVPPYDLRLYSMKRAATDINQLCRQLGYSRIVLGGHDWGGMVIWRTVNWYPELVSHAFSVCTPYNAPMKQYLSLEGLVNMIPTFGYQLHLASGEVEKRVRTRDDIRQFLKGMYGGRGPKREVMFSPTRGVLFDQLSKIGPSPLMSEQEIEYYADEWSRHGLHGPLNWYRTRKVNWEDELKLDPKAKIKHPSLMIVANKDVVLTPEMAKQMDRHFDNLSHGEVEAGHWALWEAPDTVNEILHKWMIEQVLSGKSSL